MKKTHYLLLFLLLTSNLQAIEDIRNYSWTEAFAYVHSRVEKCYPFTRHKQINMDSLYKVTAAAVSMAETANNDTAYFMAMKKYSFALKDNHVFVKRKGFDPFADLRSGHFGFEIAILDQGEVVVSQVRTDSSELIPGIKAGTRISSWDNVPIMDAIRNTSLMMEERMEATAQNRLLRKCQLLMYAPEGTKAVVVTADTLGKQDTLYLQALPDKELKPVLTYPKQSMWRKAMQSPVDFNIFEEEKIGYFQISSFMPNLGDFSLPSTFQQKLWILEKFQVEGLIIDVRGNQGGVDNWAMKMAGHFVTEPRHYQYVSKYSETEDAFVIDTSLTATVKPRKPYFDRPVIILVDEASASTAEGLPMVLQGLPKVKVMGQYGTAGAFATGFSDFIFKMPGGIVFGFLEGRSLDADHQIQVDADARGNGGVVPDVRIPVNLESIRACYAGHRDYVLEYAIGYITNHTL